MSEPSNPQQPDGSDPFAKPAPPLDGGAPQAPYPGGPVQYQRPPRAYSPGTIVAGIFSGLFGVLIVGGILGAAATTLDYGTAAEDLSGAGTFLAAVLPIGGVIALGVVLVRKGSPQRRGWGMGLLLSIPIGLVLLPVIGLVACFVLLAGSGY